MKMFTFPNELGIFQPAMLVDVTLPKGKCRLSDQTHPPSTGGLSRLGAERISEDAGIDGQKLEIIWLERF